MKLFFSYFLVIFFLNTTVLYSKTVEGKYNIKAKSLIVGELFWTLEINKNKYLMKINLYNKGMLSSIYKFNGIYSVWGNLENEIFAPKEYTQYWETSKQKKVVDILFDKKKVSRLTLSPVEKESARINYFNLLDYVDPLTSFLNIIKNKKNSKTIDGRRTYTLSVEENGEENKIKKINIKNYTNIWADHKRNDLKYIEILENKSAIDLLPQQINIKFKGTVFKLIFTLLFLIL